jgi:hypothetical protein
LAWPFAPSCDQVRGRLIDLQSQLQKGRLRAAFLFAPHSLALPASHSPC